MLRVIIADDEDRICQLIQALADWHALGMEVVGVAHNGIEAMEKIKETQPDVLITDIRMPGCDGLRLICDAKETIPQLEVIIISGYAQFDYARTAIQYGVGEYLLKPINKDALHSTLMKIGEKCKARNQAETDIQCLRNVSKDNRTRLRSILVGDLMHGNFSVQDGADLEEKYHFTGGEGYYRVFLVKIDCDMDDYTAFSMDIVCGKLMDAFQPLLAPLCIDLLMGREGSMVLGVLHYDKAVGQEVRKQVREGLNQFIAQKNLFGAVELSLALGTEGSNPSVLADATENARKLLDERMLEGTGRVFEGAVTPSGVLQMGLIARYLQDAVSAIDTLNVRSAHHVAEALQQTAISQHGIRGWELKELVQGAVRVFLTRLGVPNSDEVMQSFEKSLDQCAQAETLFACMKRLQEEQIEETRRKRKEQDGQPIRMAKQYIRNHFSEPITLEEVSAAIGFSPNYFSTMFKKETGEGFARYLSHMRMEEARGLLRDTRLSALEICKRVGFGDIKHFTRTFRMENGLTPTEYRKLYG